MTSQAKVFIPRTTAPKVTDQDWVHYTKGGNNYCLLINGTSVLPNCVGYAWGRWREILNAHHLLCKGNAASDMDNFSQGKFFKKYIFQQLPNLL